MDGNCGTAKLDPTHRNLLRSKVADLSGILPVEPGWGWRIPDQGGHWRPTGSAGQARPCCLRVPAWPAHHSWRALAAPVRPPASGVLTHVFC